MPTPIHGPARTKTSVSAIAELGHDSLGLLTACRSDLSSPNVSKSLLRPSPLSIFKCTRRQLEIDARAQGVHLRQVGFFGWRYKVILNLYTRRRCLNVVQR